MTRQHRVENDQIVRPARTQHPHQHIRAVCQGVQARALKPSQLEAQTWPLREEGSDTRRQVATWWHRHRLNPARTMTFDNPDAVKRAVMASLGIAMVSRLTVAEDLASRRIAVIPIKGSLPTRELLLVDHPQKHHGAACRAMLDLLEQIFRRGSQLVRHSR